MEYLIVLNYYTCFLNLCIKPLILSNSKSYSN
nr:MAG TPA: hypothetical protein [Bacteriophage sp.]